MSTDNTLPHASAVADSVSALGMPSTPTLSASPLLPPHSPSSRYLELLAAGHTPQYATAYAGWSDQEREDGSKELARTNPEFRQLEDLLLFSALTGQRPAIARAFLAHKSLTAAMRLDAMAANPDVAPRDRIRADVAILDHGPLAPALAAQVLVVDSSVGLLARLDALAAQSKARAELPALSAQQALDQARGATE